MHAPPPITGPGQKTERIGLYGGSFDPVHCAHLLVAQAAQEELGLDRVIFIPAAQSPFKTAAPAAPADTRLRFLKLALAERPGWIIDDQEIRRGAPSYSIDTVRSYAAQSPHASLFYLIGLDHVGQLTKWREADTLARMTDFVVIPRPGQAPVAVPDAFRLHWLRGFPFALSSSEVRARAAARKPIDLLVPSEVAKIIQTEHTYSY